MLYLQKQLYHANHNFVKFHIGGLMDAFDSLQKSLREVTRSNTYIGFTAITQQAKKIDKDVAKLKKADKYLRSFAFHKLNLSIREFGDACLTTRKTRGWRRWEEVKHPLVKLMSDTLAYFEETAKKHPEIDTDEYLQKQKEAYRSVAFSDRDFDILR